MASRQTEQVNDAKVPVFGSAARWIIGIMVGAVLGFFTTISSLETRLDAKYVTKEQYNESRELIKQRIDELRDDIKALRLVADRTLQEVKNK